MLMDGVVIVICFVLSALFSGAETGSYMINRIRLRYRVEHRDHVAQVLERVLQDPHIFVFTMLIGQNIVVYQLSHVVTELFLQGGFVGGRGGWVWGFIPWNAEMAATLTLTIPLFLFAEIGPKNLMRNRADIWMFRVASPLRFFQLLFYPLTVCLRLFFQLLMRGAEGDSADGLRRLSPEGLKAHIEAEGLMSSHQSRMLENATSMHRISVRELMTPFKDVAVLPKEAVVEDLRAMCAVRGVEEVILIDHHRVVGLVSLYAVAERHLEASVPLLGYAEDLLFVDESRNLKTAFYRLRRNPRHCAVIVDARTHPVGMIRIENLARYIAGRES